MKDFQDIDAHLEDWSVLRASRDFSGILIGNGASRTIWEDFAYDSLFENARTVEEKPSANPNSACSTPCKPAASSRRWAR